MLRNKLLAVAALIAGLLLPAQAMAYEAYTRADLNLRVGPGTTYGVIDVIPYGEPVLVLGCLEDWFWCDIEWFGMRGWVAAEFLVEPGTSVYLPQFAPRVGLPIIGFSFYRYHDRHYRDRPWYKKRSGRWHGHDWRRDHRHRDRPRYDRRRDRRDADRPRRGERIQRSGPTREYQRERQRSEQRRERRPDVRSQQRQERPRVEQRQARPRVEQRQQRPRAEQRQQRPQAEQRQPQPRAEQRQQRPRAQQRQQTSQPRQGERTQRRGSSRGESRSRSRGSGDNVIIEPRE